MTDAELKLINAGIDGARTYAAEYLRQRVRELRHLAGMSHARHEQARYLYEAELHDFIERVLLDTPQDVLVLRAKRALTRSPS